MFKNFLKTGLRNIQRNKSSFIINTIGLSIGMACSILIFLWVVDEINYDRFHNDVDDIYLVQGHQHYSNHIDTYNSTPGLLASALKEEIPGFEQTSSFTRNNTFLFTKDDISLKESGIYAQNDFFKILTIPFIEGDVDQLLNQPNTIVISADFSNRLFGKENPVGQSVLVENEDLYTITGVFEDIPANSSIKFDFAFSYENWLQQYEWGSNWDSNGPRTIAKVNSETDITSLNKMISGFVKEKYSESVTELFLKPYADQYLLGNYENGELTGGRIEYVRLFAAIAIFVLLIACINFMNLSTAKATKRAREVGIRKSIGANKSSLVFQFFGESMLITFFSLIVGIFLVELFLPVFNSLTVKSITVDYFDPVFLSIFFGTSVFTGFVAGGYPAFYLSSFEAVKTLKGTIKSSAGEIFARKGLVIFQFSLSIILIISTIIVYQQIQYSQNKDIGYKKENLIYFTAEGSVYNNWESFKARVSEVPGVVKISKSGSTFLGKNMSTSGLSWKGKEEDATINFEHVTTDYGLIETLGFELVAGRAHSEEYGSDASALVINESAANIMGFDEPVGQYITFWGRQTEIIGVVKDFNFESVRSSVEPLFFRIYPPGAQRAFVRIESRNIQEVLSKLQAVYEDYNPEYDFGYNFVDQKYAELYRSEQRIGALSKYFALFAIIISCLGLFGLSAFTAEQRSKEVGIRKVLGATVQSIVILLSKDFTRLVLYAIFISVPISWWIMNQWLSGFAYQINLNWWIFVAAGFLAILVAWLTVSWQSIKAALMNPVKSLKSQ